jgi:hypothetical protein
MFEWDIQCVEDAREALAFQKEFKRLNDRAAFERITASYEANRAHLAANAAYAHKQRMKLPLFQQQYEEACALYAEAQAVKDAESRREMLARMHKLFPRGIGKQAVAA